MLIFLNNSPEGSPEIPGEPWATVHWGTAPTLDRALGKEDLAGLNYHSPLEESVRQGRARSRTGGGGGIDEIVT